MWWKSCLLSPCMHRSHNPVTRVYASTITIWLFFLFLPPGIFLPERKPAYKFELLLHFIHNFSKFLSRKDTYPCLLCLFAVSWVMSYIWVFWLLLEQGTWLISLGPHTMPNVWKEWLSFFSIRVLIEDIKPMQSYPLLYCNHILTPCAPQFKTLSSEIPKLPMKYSKSKYGYF